MHTYVFSQRRVTYFFKVLFTLSLALATSSTLLAQEEVIELELNQGGIAVLDLSLFESCLEETQGVSVSADKRIFTADDLGVNQVTLTFSSGNENSCERVIDITVVDKIAPVVSTKNAIKYMYNGEITISPSDVLRMNCTGGGISMNLDERSLWSNNLVDASPNGATFFDNEKANCTYDNCRIASYELSKSTFTCEDVGENTITITVTDESGNQTTATAKVTIKDSQAPVVYGKNITAELGLDGNVTITPEMVDDGSYDSCGDLTLELSKSVFSCEDIGDHQVTLIGYDSDGNTASTTVTVTVEDNSAPEVVTQNITITLDINNQASLDPMDLLVVCDDAVIDLDSNDGGFGDGGFGDGGFGGGGFDLGGFDMGGFGFGGFTPDSKDISRNSNYKASSPFVINGFSAEGCTTDNCKIIGIEASITDFDCSNIGENVVTVTVTDDKGNSTEATAIVTIVDNIAPTVSAQDFTLNLGEDGTATLEVSDIEINSADNCSIASKDLSKTNFTCDDLGENLVTLTVTDGSGNEASKTVTITVEDNTAPSVVAQDATVYLDANGNAAITVADIDNGSADNCSLTLALDILSFDCDDLGENTVTLTGTDASGNQASATATATVIDNIAPVIVAKDFSGFLDANGELTITEADIVDQVSDNCSIGSVEISKTEFGCTELGTSTVTITVTDTAGNTTTETAIVTVADNVAPVVTVQNVSLNLDANDNATLEVSDAEVSSTDNCGIASKVLSQTAFDCDDLGTNTVSLTVTDASGNQVTEEFTVTIVDAIAPTVVAQDATVYLDANGNAAITVADIDNGSADNCSLTLALDMLSFDCDDLGENTVTLTGTDASGNQASATATVTVIDNIAPVVVAKDFSGFLDANGELTITEADIVDQVSDNCAIGSVEISKTEFGCAELGTNTVTITVTDAAGNTATETAIVTVADNVAPVVTVQNVSLNLDANGNATLEVSDAEVSSTDNCGIASKVLSQTAFDCDDLGTNTVSLTVTDASGNQVTEEFTVTIVDAIAPTVVAQDATVYLDANGNASITVADIDNGSADNCSLTLALDILSFDCDDLGENTVTLTGTDASGNQASATATVTVIDNIAPVVVAKDFSGFLDANGELTITQADIVDQVSDNCSIGSVNISKTEFGCAEIGTNTITITVTDAAGNTVTETAIVTVADNVAPVVTVQNVSLSLDANGNATLEVSDAEVTSTDNCGIASKVLSQTAFDCDDLGTNTVSLTVTDASGNQVTEEFTVTIVDAIAPTVVAQDATVYLDTNGNASITVADIDNGSTDNCSLTLALDILSFDCDDLGENTVTLTGTDASGNQASATATVTVIDNIAPVVETVESIEIEIDENGSATITQTQIVTNVSNNNCGDVTITISKTDFDCTDLGENTITVSVTDSNGNTSTADVIVTVIDTSAPIIAFPGSSAGSSTSMNPTAPAMDFNVFLKEDFRVQSNETEGAVAIGGDFTLDGNYQVSTHTTGSFEVNNVPVSLVIGGKVNYQSGYSLQINQNGYVKIGDANGSKAWYQDLNNAYSPIRITKNSNYWASPLFLLQANAQTLGGVNENNNPVFEANLIDFDAAFTQLEANADALSQMDNNAELTNPNGQPISNTNLPNQVKINLQDGVNVLNVTGSDLNNMSVFTFNNQPSQSKTLVINVDAPGSFFWNVYNTGGIGEHVSPYIIYNFYNTTTLQVQGNGSVIGSILAPKAHINKTSWNNISGQIMAKSMFQKGGENHMFGFDGTIETEGGETGGITEGTTVSRESDEDACGYTVQGDEFTPTVTDNSCGSLGLSYTLSGATTGNGSSLDGVVFNIGETVITWSAGDGQNATTFSFTVNVEDTTAPTILTQNATIYLDENGSASVTINDIDNGSSDNCDITLALDKLNFDCSNLGENTVTLSGTDAAGNTAAATATVTVIDNIAPTFETVETVQAELDENGAVIITTSQVVTSTSDNCGAVNISLSKTSFDCADLGTNTVTVTATDAHGNTSTSEVEVVIIDTSAPIWTNPSSTTGSGTTASSNPLAPAMDFNVFIKDDVTFKSNETEGAVALGGDLTIDGNYQVSTNSIGSFEVQNIPVTLVVGGKVNYTSGNSLQVNQNGYAKIGEQNGSKVWYQDMNGAYTTMRVTKDNNYNSSPRLHLQAHANQLGVSEQNNHIFEANVIDFDAAFTQFEASAAAMSQLANNADITDPNGNPISNTNLPNQVKINLQDGLNVLNVTGNDLNNVSVFTFNNQPSANRILVINVDEPGNFYWNAYNTGGIGEHVAPYIIYNFYNTTFLQVQGNGSLIGSLFAPFAHINKTSHNNISGQIVGKSMMQASGENHMFAFNGEIEGETAGETTEVNNGSTVTRTTDEASCTYTVQGSEFTPGASDNSCAELSLSYALTGATVGTGSDLAGVEFNIGTTTVTWTATDGQNSTTFTFTVEVEDTIAPTPIAQDIVVNLDANGNATITAAQINNGSYDNCGTPSLSIDKPSFDCDDLGENEVTLTVTDASENTATTTATVTVADNIAPVIANMPASITVQATDGCTAVATWTIPTVSDNCSATIASNYNSGASFPVGTTEVVYTATDLSGNTSTESFSVTVLASPIVITLSATEQENGFDISCNSAADGAISAAVSGGCGNYTYAWSNGETGDNISGLSAGTYSLTVTDENNNSTTESITITEPDVLTVNTAMTPVAPGGTNTEEHTIYLGYGQQSVTLSANAAGGSGEYTYEWTPNEAMGCIDGNTVEVAPLVTTTYSVTVTDQMGCSVVENITVTVIDVRCTDNGNGGGNDDSEEEDDPTDCQCEGKMKDFTVVYNGYSGATVRAYNKNKSSVIKTFYNVQNGDVLKVEGFDHKGRLDAKTFLKVGSTYTEIHTSCSINILGETYGDFKVIEYTDGEGSTCSLEIEAFSQSSRNGEVETQNEELQAKKSLNDETPSEEANKGVQKGRKKEKHPPYSNSIVTTRNNFSPVTSNSTGNEFDCQCEGKMKDFTFTYTGPSGIDIKAYNKKKNTVIKTFYNVQTGNELKVEGFDHKGRLDAKTFLQIGDSWVEIHTSCSINILGKTYGPFKVIEYTDGEGATCTLDTNDKDECNLTLTQWSGNIAICYSGTSMCVPQSEVSLYLSQGAKLGDCGLGNQARNTGDLVADINNTDSPQDAIIEVNVAAYPNPTKDYAKITFSTNTDALASVAVYDTRGMVVGRLYDGDVEAGKTYNVEFNGTNVINGVYLVRVNLGNHVETKKLLIKH